MHSVSVYRYAIPGGIFGFSSWPCSFPVASSGGATETGLFCAVHCVT